MTFKLKSLNEQEIRDFCKELAKSDSYSVIITLTSGELLFGDLRLEIKFHDEKPDEQMWYIARYEEGFGYLAVKLLPEILLFNTENGQKYQDSYLIDLKNELISGITKFSWNNNNFKAMRWIPNPYAKLIAENNLRVAQNNQLNVGSYFEGSLSDPNLPFEGIKFDYEELIYVDWDFIKNLTGGTDISMGAYGVGLRPGRSIYNLVMDKIKEGTIEKIMKFLPGKSLLGEARISGYLEIPNPNIETIMEGDECIVALCCENNVFDPDDKYIPIILKKKSISYPIEYLPYISSKLVFYGEIKQIPINEKQIVSEAAVMIRALGYINNQN